MTTGQIEGKGRARGSPDVEGGQAGEAGEGVGQGCASALSKLVVAAQAVGSAEIRHGGRVRRREGGEKQRG